MVSLELSIQLVQPQHIIQNFNGKDEFSEEVKRYQFYIKIIKIQYLSLLI